MVLVILTITMSTSATAVANEKGERISVGNFKEVEIDKAWEVIITQGNSNSLRIEVPEEWRDKVEIYERRERLYISQKGRRWPALDNLIRDERPRAYLQVKDIRKLIVRAASVVRCESPLSTREDFELRVQGASKLWDLDLTCDDLTIQLDGASKCEIKAAKASDVEMKAAGASKLGIENLQCEEVEAKASGASHISLEGSNLIEEANYDAVGASSIRASDLRAKVVEAEAVGASSIDCHATKEAELRAIGASTISLYGNPRHLKDFASGGSRIKER